MSSFRVSTPSTLVVSIDDAKLYARIDESAEDDTVERLIRAATAYCESYTQSQFINAGWKRTLDRWPSSGIAKIHRGPLVSVQSVQYIDSDDQLQTWDSDNYLTISQVSPGQLGFLFAASGPPHKCQPHAITINYTAGYGTSPDAVPHQAKQAIYLLAGYWFANRETVVVGTISGEIAFSTHALLDQISFSTFSEDN